MRDHTQRSSRRIGWQLTAAGSIAAAATAALVWSLPAANKPAPNLPATPSSTTVASPLLPTIEETLASTLQTAENISAEPTDPQCADLGYSSPSSWSFMPDKELRRTLDEAAKAGGKHVRLGVEWGNIETAPGEYDWSTADRMIDDAIDSGMDVVGLLGVVPPWQRDKKTAKRTEHTAPIDHNEFAKFAALAAARYGDKIAAWEVWNEPNIWDFWTTGADPVRYTNLLKATYTAIKRADPDATVISGGLAPSATTRVSMEPVEFLEKMYEAGAAGYFDGFGMHPYSFPLPPTSDEGNEWNPWHHMKRSRALMERYGDGDKKMWLTEFGAPTGEHKRSLPDEQQARIIVDAIRAAAKTPWIGPLLLFSIRDTGPDKKNMEHNFGIITHDWQKKGSYSSVLAAVRAFGC